MEFGKTYCNTGDWVESCTALVENEAGQLLIAGRFTEGTAIQTG